MSKLTQVVRSIDGTGIPLLLARLAVGLLFAYLALKKLADPFEFLKQIHLYQIFADRHYALLNWTALVLPYLELFCAAALILGIFRRGAALLIFGMLTFFAPVLLLRAWGFYTAPGAHFAAFCDVKFDCGCGTGDVFICRKMLENTIAQILVLIPLFSRSQLLCLSALFTRRSHGVQTPGRP